MTALIAFINSILACTALAMTNIILFACIKNGIEGWLDARKAAAETDQTAE